MSIESELNESFSTAIEEDLGAFQTSSPIVRPLRKLQIGNIPTRENPTKKNTPDCNFTLGKARVPYKLPTLMQRLSKNTITPDERSSLSTKQLRRLKKCSRCPPVLSKMAVTLQVIGQHGRLLHNRKSSHKSPKNPHNTQYRNKTAENSWCLSNLFDAQGNYLYCYSCIQDFLGLSSQRITRLHKIKRAGNTKPIQELIKSPVEQAKLTNYTLPPQSTDTSFRDWWDGIDEEATVQVKYPYNEHGLSRKKSNHSKKQQTIEVYT